MRSPQPMLLNIGLNTPSPRPRIQSPFQSTVHVQKLRRVNVLILVLRFLAFCFSLAAAIFMFTNFRDSGSKWQHYDAFRFVAFANAIVAVYSLLQVGASVWEVSRGTTVFTEIVQVWFDFCLDQVFAYLLLSIDAAGAAFARTMRDAGTCAADNAFCVQSYISIALGFAGFVFLGSSSLLSGFRVVCFVINGSRFRL
nr:CASP-like protein 4C1 [Ipomoea trifida]